MVDADQLDGVVDVVDEVFDCSRRVAGELFIDLGEFHSRIRRGDRLAVG